MSALLDDIVDRAAITWCGRKERETGQDDIAYFKNNWRALPGLFICVVDELVRTPAPHKQVTEAMPNWNGWRSIDTAPEGQHVILATSGGHVGEAIMLIDESTGRQKWAWALGPVRSNHAPWGWMHFASPLTAPVLSDLRPEGFDGPTGAE